jgi:hypothetical protein
MYNKNNQKEATVVFLIPFASKRVKKNWFEACRHLEQTLKSILNSSCSDYRVVVVGHEFPDFTVEIDERFKFISLDHDLPFHTKKNIAGIMDKMIKIEAAWNYVKNNYSSKYIFKLDADDLISSRLVDYLKSSIEEDGFLITKGWIWKSNSKIFIQKTETFDQSSGSCVIINSKKADLQGPFLTSLEGHNIIVSAAAIAKLPKNSLIPNSKTGSLLLNESHFRTRAQFNYLNLKLKTFPFESLVFRTGNSDSLWSYHSKYTLRRYLGKIRRIRFISKHIRREFSIPI